MDVHHRCHSLVPNTCGQDNTEPHGRIKMLIKCIPSEGGNQRINIQGIEGLTNMYHWLL